MKYLTVEQAREMLGRLVAEYSSGEPLVIPRERIEVVSADPSDNMALEAAVAGRADAVVTGDRHLFRLRTFRGIPIMTARRFLAEHL